MKHILGMAKSNLDLRGAKSSKLELDVLRLVYAVQHLRMRDGAAHGYVLVLGQSSAQRVATWLKKYDALDCIECTAYSPSEVEAEALIAEKQANRHGMIVGSQGVAVEGRSSGAVGERIGEAALRRWIHSVEPLVTTQLQNLPFNIRWDFYGVVK